MTYELAKQLKEAGFPDSQYWDDEGDAFWVTGTAFRFKVPTLPELIEACRGRIQTFRFFMNFVSNEYGIQKEEQGLDDVMWYSTPDEAVAKLWIELNAKQ